MSTLSDIVIPEFIIDMTTWIKAEPHIAYRLNLASAKNVEIMIDTQEDEFKIYIDKFKSQADNFDSQTDKIQPQKDMVNPQKDEVEPHTDLVKLEKQVVKLMTKEVGSRTEEVQTMRNLLTETHEVQIAKTIKTQFAESDDQAKDVQSDIKTENVKSDKKLVELAIKTLIESVHQTGIEPGKTFIEFDRTQ